MKTQSVKALFAAAAFIAGQFAISMNAQATAPNTTAANSVAYEVGQGWVTHYFDEATQNRWFRFGEIGGHSYCVEAVQGPVSPVEMDPNLTIYADAAGVTQLTVSGTALTNNDGSGVPYLIKGSRICYIAPTSVDFVTIRGIKLNVPIVAGSGDAGYVRLRVVDTTVVFAATTSYAGQAGQYGSTAQMISAVPTPIKVRLSFRTGNVVYPFGSNCGSTCSPYVIDSNGGSTNTIQPYSFLQGGVDARTAPTTPSTLWGIAYIAHDGAPGALKGSTYTTAIDRILIIQ